MGILSQSTEKVTHLECGSDSLEDGGVKVVRLPGPEDKRDKSFTTTNEGLTKNING